MHAVAAIAHYKPKIPYGPRRTCVGTHDETAPDNHWGPVDTNLNARMRALRIGTFVTT